MREFASIRNELSLGRLFHLVRGEVSHPSTTQTFQLSAVASAWPGCQGCPIRLARLAWKPDVRPYHPEARRRVRSLLVRTERCLLPAPPILLLVVPGQ